MEILRNTQNRGGWLTAFGVLSILLGFFAISASFLTTLITVTVFGILLIVGGVVQLVHAFQTRRWGGFWMNAMLGALYLVFGMVLLSNPAGAAITLTLAMALFFVGTGLIRCLMAGVRRFDHWNWYLFSGLVALLLGAVIWMQWPISGLFTIGLFVGIDLLLIGWSLIALAWETHRLTPTPL